MARFGPALMTGGTVLLLIPLAELMDALGYSSIGSAFVLVGSAVVFTLGLFGSGRSVPDR